MRSAVVVVLFALLAFLVPTGGARPRKGAPGKEGAEPPSTRRVTVAICAGNYDSLPGVLIRREAGATGPQSWKKVKRGEAVRSTDTLLGLPGFACAIEAPAVALLLRGNVREFALAPLQQLLLESAVVLHQSKEVDLDLTLLRGRIFLTNRKESGPARIRLRFAGRENWDITLKEKAQVGVDFFTVYPAGVGHHAGEEPRAYLYLVLVRGQATVRVEATTSLTAQAKPPGAHLFAWDSARGPRRPVTIARLPPSWSKAPPTAVEAGPDRKYLLERMQEALKGLRDRLAGPASVATAIREGLAERGPMTRRLSICCLGAIDDVGKLVDEMGDPNTARGGDRAAAVFALRRWLNRGAAQGKILFDEKNSRGVLIERKFEPAEARTIRALLYDLPPDQWNRPETFERLARDSRSRRVAVAELAYSHLLRLARGVKLPAFDAADPIEKRGKFADRIDEMIAKKQLPPPKRKEGK